MIGFGVRFLVQLSAFWLLDTRGTRQLVDTLTMFSSGVMAPLMLFPDWLEPVARALPFAGMIQTPVEVYLGSVRGGAAIVAVGVQFLWVAALFAGGRLLMTTATRRVVIQGG